MIEQANAVASTAGGAAALTGVSRPVLLREAREAAGLHIAALAAALKVPVKKLEALEAGRYDELPDMTFARALAASACRHLKVDAASVLEQIPLGAQPKLGDSPQAINAPYKTSQDAAPTTAASWLTRPAVLGALALLLGALVIVFLPELPGIDSAPEPAPTAAPPTEAPSTEAPQVPPVVVDPAATVMQLEQRVEKGRRLVGRLAQQVQPPPQGLDHARHDIEQLLGLAQGDLTPCAPEQLADHLAKTQRIRPSVRVGQLCRGDHQRPGSIQEVKNDARDVVDVGTVADLPGDLVGQFLSGFGKAQRLQLALTARFVLGIGIDPALLEIGQGLRERLRVGTGAGIELFHLLADRLEKLLELG